MLAFISMHESKTMNELDPLEIEILSTKQKNCKKTLHKKCNAKTILLAMVVILAILFLTFMLLHVLKKLCDCAPENGFCLTSACIESAQSK